MLANGVHKKAEKVKKVKKMQAEPTAEVVGEEDKPNKE